MLNYRMKLYEETLKETINRYHLNPYMDQVKALNEKLYEEVQGKVAYKLISRSKGERSLDLLNQQGDQEYDQGIIGLVTLGYEFERLIQRYQQEPLSQHILDVLGNALLDEVLAAFRTDVLQLSQLTGLGPTCFPGSHLPLEMNRIIYQGLKEDIKEEAHINEQEMMVPMKTIAFMSGEVAQKEQKREHHCNRCTSCHCPHRQSKVELTVLNKDKVTVYEIARGENLLKVLNEKGYAIPQACGGIKKCGKCLVKVVNPNVTIQPIDEQSLETKALDEGIRCACAITLNEALTVELIEEQIYKKDIQVLGIGRPTDKYGIAVDVGTTTVEAALVSLDTGKCLTVIREENKQKKYGLDVISRAKWSQENKEGMKIIQNTILRQLQDIVYQMIDYASIEEKQIQQIILSANTIMSYFIIGKDTSKVVVAPFEVVSRTFETMTGDQLGLTPSIEVVVLPVVAAYMGSDILSGIVYTKMTEASGPCLLIDLGTNGEMVIGNGYTFKGCSTAVGPAFEGTHIRHGMSALEGAIYAYDSPDKYAVIGDKKAVGLCGSGIIDVVDYLLRTGKMDDTGLLANLQEKKEDLTDDICITQQDIRQFQMAKSAIRTGIEILLKAYQAEGETLQKVYITGGFGEYIHKQKAIEIGLIPKTFEGKIEALHNTSLQGAIQILLKTQRQEEYHTLSQCVDYIELADQPAFQELYIKHMNFT